MKVYLDYSIEDRSIPPWERLGTEVFQEVYGSDKKVFLIEILPAKGKRLVFEERGEGESYRFLIKEETNVEAPEGEGEKDD